MLRYVPPLELTAEQMRKLSESWSKGGGASVEAAENVLSGRWKVFALKHGVIAVSRSGTTMTIEAVHAERFGWFVRQLRDVLVKLATEWGCNTVETYCFDERLASAMLHVDGKHVAWLVAWDIEELTHGR